MEKLKKVIKQSKNAVIVIGVLWVILSIVLVSPIAYSIKEATNELGQFDLSVFIEELVPALISFTSIFKMFSPKYFGTFMACLLIFTAILVYCSIKGFNKSKPKGDYHDKEHGSSDWSKNGEQYKLLSKNKGIILAEDNYLPVDKRGNINTLIVGRIRFW